MKTASMLLSLLFALPIQALAAVENVALNKTVTLGTSGAVFFNVSPDAGYNPAEASTVTDGVLRPTGVDWKDGTVFWADSYAGEHWVEISLGGLYEISGFNAQLNENDYYTLFYRDSGGQWQTAWTIGWGAGCCMQTRETSLGATILTSALKLEGYFNDGGTNPFPTPYVSDNLFSVAEIQAFGVLADDTPVPEPAALALVGLGLLALSHTRRFRYQLVVSR